MKALHAVVGCLLVSACSKKQPEIETHAVDAAIDAPAAGVQLVSRDASVNLMEITSDVKSRKDPRYAGLPLFEKLAVERSDRPKETMHADAFYDELAGQGIAITNRHQVLGQIVGAAYCLKADAEPEIDLTVCEFDDAASLAKGKAAINSVPYPQRTLYAQKTSTLGLGKLGKGKATEEAAAKIVATMKKM